jgi:hypothetical protein
MFIDKDSLKVTVGNKTINLGDYIVEAKYQYPKLWSEDSGRNLAGKMIGTLIGIFPKITVQFRKLSKLELEEIAFILDSATQKIEYYDVKKKQNVLMETYTGDWEVTNNNIGSNKGFSISFISRSKRV